MEWYTASLLSTTVEVAYILISNNVMYFHFTRNIFTKNQYIYILDC